jgi:hypothetical protein
MQPWWVEWPGGRVYGYTAHQRACSYTPPPLHPTLAFSPRKWAKRETISRCAPYEPLEFACEIAWRAGCFVAAWVGRANKSESERPIILRCSLVLGYGFRARVPQVLDGV